MEEKMKTTYLLGFRVAGLGKNGLGSRLVMGMSRVTLWVIGAVNLISKSPDPPSNPKRPSTQSM